MSSAPTSTFQRDRNPSPEKMENVQQDQAETDWDIVRKQKRKGKSKEVTTCPNKRQDGIWKDNIEEETSEAKGRSGIHNRERGQ